VTKRWVTIGIVFASPLVILLLFLIFERARGEISLARAKHKLTGQGEKLSVAELSRPYSPGAGSNGAPEFYAAYQQLEAGTVLPDNYPPRMTLTAPGRAIIGFRREEWVSEKKTNHWSELAQDLKNNEAQLVRLRRALASPVLDNEVDLGRGSKLDFKHVLPAKRAAQWLGSAAQLALREGRTADAADNLVSQIQLARLLARDQLLISELVRIAVAAIARTQTWEALAAEGWTDEDLAKIQSAWEATTFVDSMERSLQGERVFGLATYTLMRKSNEETYAVLLGMSEFLDAPDESAIGRLVQAMGAENFAKFVKKEIYCRVWRFAWLAQCERRSLAQGEELIQITRAAAQNKSLGQTAPDLDRLAERCKNNGFYDELRFPGPSSALILSRATGRAMRAETERSLTLCAIALKRYRLRHGSVPESLERLIPELLPAVPVDYMDGKPVRYKPDKTGGFTLYSIGADGRDDGGDASPTAKETAVQNIWNRKDFVWPAPALPGEKEE
jgi:hypothetical protein